jgi:alanine dehydrogenase
MADPYQEIPRRSTADRLLPQEEMLEVARRKSRLLIGIPKEIFPEENRIPLVPGGVQLLSSHEHQVIVEAGAGENAHFPDHEFSEAGARIVYSAKEVYEADIIMKVAPATREETDLLHPRKTIISALQASMRDDGYFRTLMQKKITALAWELIRDRHQSMPVIRAMSEIAGNTSIFIASEYLASREFGRGKMFGGFTGIPPSEVVIIGAGTVGEFAARSAIGLGAVVKVFDNSLHRLRRLQSNLGVRIYTSTLHPSILLDSISTADVVIGAVHSIDGKSPCLINEGMVSSMKDGSVIIDVSIDQGGCFETSHVTSHNAPVFKMHGVTHYCVPNIPSRVPHTASQALNNIFIPVLLAMGEEGGVESMIKRDFGVRQGVYLFNGTLTSQPIGRLFNLPYQDIELLLAASQ